MKALERITKLAGKLPGRALLPPLMILGVFLVGWYVGLPAKSVDEVSGGDDTVWTCSMHPQIRQPNFGLCPLCSMDLIPLAPGGDGGLREIQVSPEAAALMDLRVSEVVRVPAAVDVELFGRLAYDERNITTVTARIGGRLDRFFVDFTGTEVRKGFHMAEIYSPELLVAQKDLIKAAQSLDEARKSGTQNAVSTQERLLKSARERLRLLQLKPEQIDKIASSAQPEDHITLYSPQDGVVTARHVVEGAYIKEGEPLFSVAGMQSIWLNLEAYETDLPWLTYAQEVTFTVEAIPGETFSGRIAYIDQEIDPRRRVLKIRVNVDNKKRLLKPGMFARATVDARMAADGSVIDEGLAGKWISPMHPEIVEDAPGDCPICGMALVPAEELGFIRSGDGKFHENPLLIPAQAVLQTGKRSTVYVRLSANPEPKFEGREVILGPRVGDRFIVESGLSDGEYVVTNGAFKLDSELQIRAKPSMMNRNSGLIETPAAEAEANLLGQWSPVPRALGRFEAAAKRSDPTAGQDAIADMQAAISAVDTSSFQPSALQDWREFSMRLTNALQLANLAPPSDLPTAYRDVRHAVEEAGRYLGLPNRPVRGGEPASAEMLAALRKTMEQYYPLVSALAADDLKNSITARDRLLPHLDGIGANADGLKAAKDIEALRLATEPVSSALIDKVKAIGADHVGTAYVVHCPMAFGNKGADWISQTPTVLNPYFGSEMLTCGTVKTNLSFDRARAPVQEKPIHIHPE